MFEIGQEYHRKSQIHGLYGGQQQGGISTPKDQPFIFLFTGQGEGYGYADGWREGVFHYSGEGQTGDMVWEAGNRALRDHAENGKDLHLFRNLGKGKPVQYLGQFICSGWHSEQTSDREGEKRRAFIFHLVPLENSESEQVEPLQTVPRPLESLENLRERAFSAASVPESPPREAKCTVRQRSAAVREYVLARASGTCESCGAPAPFLRVDGTPYLEPHHVRRLSDGGPDHPRWVAAVCPNCHRRIHCGVDGARVNSELIARLETIEHNPTSEPG